MAIHESVALKADWKLVKILCDIVTRHLKASSHYEDDLQYSVIQLQIGHASLADVTRDLEPLMA